MSNINTSSKQYLSTNRRPNMGRSQQAYQKYMDVMSASLNQCMVDNIKPHWRDHASVKGWTSMNYPTVLQNPLLKRRETKKEKEEMHQNIRFSNMERPVTGQQQTKSFHRPFSTKEGGETLMHKRKTMMYKDQSAEGFDMGDEADRAGDKGLPHIHSVDRLNTAQTFQFGRSLQSAYHQARARPDSQNVGYTFWKCDAVFGAMPQKKLTGKEKKEAEEKRKLAEAEALELKKQPKYISKEVALQNANSWQNSVSINKKYAVGTLASSKYEEKTAVFNRVHDGISDKSNIWPMENYFGQKPDPEKDPFNRRTVKQLNDISFSEDSEDDFEDVRAMKRQRRTILTEENLKKYLGEETIRLNIEHHYWLKDSFLSKIGKMAPNLSHLCLRRLKISNDSFSDLSNHLKHIEALDISDCFMIQEQSVIKFLTNNAKTLKKFQASNCIDAITNTTLKQLVEIEDLPLEFLDISFAKLVTDEGLMPFQGKTLPITHLCMNGLSLVTGAGLYHPVYAARDTLLVFQGALMDQEDLKIAEWGKALGQCFQLESLDVGGCKHITDEFFFNLTSGSYTNDEGQVIKPGLTNLKCVKLNRLELIFNESVLKICNQSSILEQLELTGCKNLNEYGIETIFKTFKNLLYVDVNHIPVMTPAFYEVLKGHRPDINLRRFKFNEVDPKDNMLRVPLRIISKGKKSKKKKKKKKS